MNMRLVEAVKSPVGVSTKRTAVNITAVGVVTWLVAKVTGLQFEITPDDLLMLAPVFGVVGGIGYRLSRWLVARFPVLGWVVFGSGKEPAGLRDIQKAA